jgi:hypothetical protein
MRQQEVAGKVSELRRREAFRVLVVAQDMEMSVAESRQMVRDSFGLTEADLRRVEREGIEWHWPPL